MALTVGTNTYISLADFKAWAATRLAGAFVATTADATLETALQEACGHIEQLHPVGWQGERTIYNQRLAWPRVNVLDPDSSSDTIVSASIIYFDGSTMPQPLKDAQCEEALLLLRLHIDGSAGDRELNQQMGVTDIGIGAGVYEKYKPKPKFGGCLLSEAAWLLVKTLRKTGPVPAHGRAMRIGGY
jgi:hypothetical protein